MKAKEKIKDIASKIAIILLTIIIFNFSEAIAIQEIEIVEKSEEFEKWENLSEEEREDSIEPTYYATDLKQSIKRSSYNNMLANTRSSLDSSYNLRDYINIENKNQQKTGACWAFSFSSVLETSLAKQESKNLEFSPIHIEYIATKMFNRKFGDGGNSGLATSYCISGKGPALEEEMPFDNYYDETNNTATTYYLTPIENIEDPNVEAKAKINETTIFPTILKKYVNNNIKYYQSDGITEYSNDELKAIRDLLKQHIKENGAISAAIYSDIQIDKNGIYNTSYYNQENFSYFCNDTSKTTNHAITIVGWDDNYSVDKFREDCRPSSPGAYIVLNSYGTEVGDSGYIYISYEDIFIETFLMGIDDIQQTIDYDKIYQYDELGVNTALTFNNTSIYGGVKFERDNTTEKREYLNEVGIYLLDAEGIQIYLNSESDDFNNTELVYSSENALEAGYHSIKLSYPMELKGEKFAIIVKYTNKEVASLPIECNLTDSRLSIMSNYYDKAKSNPGQSFFSIDGTTWQEVSGTNLIYAELKNTDVCIKGFTILSDTPLTIPVSEVKLNNNAVTIKEESSATLIETVEPSVATNKNVTWSSSNEEIATVNGGVVTGKKIGQATITVTTEDGGKIASCTVTVTQKDPETIAVESISLNETEISLSVGKTHRLAETIQPSTATNKNVAWSSSNVEIATVNAGVVTANKEGEATITVTTEDGKKTATCRITVTGEQAATIRVEKITLDKTEKTIQVGDNTNLIVSFSPSNVSNKNIRWESSNEEVATVTGTGVITAISEGKTIIKAISEDGNKEATCELTVVKKTNTDDDIYKDGTNYKIDDTVSNSELPNTGVKIVIVVMVIGVIIFTIIKFIKYRDLKDIK